MINNDEAKKIREKDNFDPRNLLDCYKGIPTEDVKEMISKNKKGLVAALSNEIRDFNWGTVVRNANAFGLDHVVFCGKKRWDRRGAVGAQNYTDIRHDPSLTDLIERYREDGYSIVAIEYDESYRDKMVEMKDHNWEEKTLMIFGEEGNGLSHSILDMVDHVVYIPMYGCVRSINVGVASGIIFNDYNYKIRV